MWRKQPKRPTREELETIKQIFEETRDDPAARGSKRSLQICIDYVEWLQDGHGGWFAGFLYAPASNPNYWHECLRDCRWFLVEQRWDLIRQPLEAIEARFDKIDGGEKYKKLLYYVRTLVVYGYLPRGAWEPPTRRERRKMVAEDARIKETSSPESSKFEKDWKNWWGESVIPAGRK